MEVAADLKGATDVAGRKMEDRGEMETSTGDEDKKVHKRRPGELRRCTGEQKVKLGQRFKRKSNVIKSGKMEGDGS